MAILAAFFHTLCHPTPLHTLEQHGPVFEVAPAVWTW